MKLIVLVVCTLSVFAAHAQGRRGAAQAASLEAQLEAAEAQGAAAAVRPGDEDLTCEQLQAEITAAAQSPEFLAALQPLAAQSDPAQIEEAQQELTQQTQGPPRGGLVRSLAAGAVTAVLPNSVGAAAQQATAVVQGARMQVQAAQNQQQIFDSASQLVGLMGMAERSQRVIELAEAKKCDWLKGDPLSAPEPTPEPQAERRRR